MPHQLELFPTDDSEDFDSPYLDLRVAINTLEQLDFASDRLSLALIKPHKVYATVGHYLEPADPRDRDIFAQLVEDLGCPISRCGPDASINMGKLNLTLRGAFPNPSQVGDRPTIEDLYPTTKFGERGERGRLNPLMETALGQFRPKDQ